MADGMIIGHDNRYTDGTPVATDTDADPDFDARNVSDLRKYTLWRAAGKGQKYLYVDALTAKAVNTLGIRGHNLGTGEADVVVESSPGFSLSDQFNDSSLDPTNFGTSLAAAGSANELTTLIVSASTGAADAAIVYDKNLMGPRGLPWTLKNKSKVATSVASDALLMAYYQSAALPVVAAEATFLAKAFVTVSQSSTGDIHFTYLDGSAVRWFWDGSAWQNTTQTAYAGVLNTEYITHMINDGNSLVIQVWDSTETTLHATATVLWTSVAVEAGDAYGLFGWAYTDKLGSIHTSTLWEHTSFFNSTWTTRLAAFTPDSDGLIFRRLTSHTERFWRVGFNSATLPPEVAILILGARVDIPYSADAPIDLYDEGTQGPTLEDDSDELLGTTVTHKNRRLSFSVSTVERTFVFSDWQALWDDHLSDRKPIIIAIYPDDFPEAIWFMFPVPSYRWKTPLRIFPLVESIRLDLRGPKEIIPAEDVSP